jgi:hypothetical protein
LSNIVFIWSDVDVDKELEKQGTRFALGCAEFPINFKDLSFDFGPPLKSKLIRVISVLYFERLEMQAETLHVDINVRQPNIWQSPPCTSVWGKLLPCGCTCPRFPNIWPFDVADSNNFNIDFRGAQYSATSGV